MTTQPATSIHLAGTLHAADMWKTEPIPFDVPAGIRRIHITFRHTPVHGATQKLPNQISLMVFDPQGPRCEISRPTTEGVIIGEDFSSPGGLAGPIQPGRWMIFVLVFRLLSDEGVAYTLDIDLYATQPEAAAPPGWKPGRTASRGPGWYRGDLHAHTVHSDGHWSIAELVAFWRARRVDFMTLSDHNTISGLAELYSHAGDDLLTLGGIELSTFFGHAVALGANRWFDWRRLDGSQLTMRELAQAVIDGGALFHIAHPMDVGDPLCCGCRWEYVEMMPGNATGVEIWNEGWSTSNQEALQIFYRWLNLGYRLTATAGTDLHGPPAQEDFGAVNAVYADDLTRDALLAAIRAGRSYLTTGPTLLLGGETAGGVQGIAGTRLPRAATRATVEWQGAPTASMVRFVVDGRVVREELTGAGGRLEFQVDGSQVCWYTAELRTPDERLHAVSNPIFFGPDPVMPDGAPRLVTSVAAE